MVSKEMSVPPIPPPLDQLKGRPFSFYPPILNIEHNEWFVRRGSWSEVLVWNPKTNIEVWVPRRFLGELSRVDEPVMIVGLRKELEFKAGSVWPHERRVIEMPKAVNEGFRTTAPEAQPARTPVIGIRLESQTESRIGLLIAAVLALSIVACFLIVSVFRQRASGGRILYRPLVQAELGFTAQDDYYAVVRKLGQPGADRWRSEQGERQYRALWYPQHSLTIILMGADRNKALYIGAKDKDWKNIHAVDLPGRQNTESMLRSLQRF